MKAPPRWTEKQLANEAKKSVRCFGKRASSRRSSGKHTLIRPCQVSNSATNSVKRINNDAAAKASRWIGDFGNVQVVPTAVIAGVFNVGNLLQAQEAGLTLFWAHDLKKLGRFIKKTGEQQEWSNTG